MQYAGCLLIHNVALILALVETAAIVFGEKSSLFGGAAFDIFSSAHQSPKEFQFWETQILDPRCRVPWTRLDKESYY